MRDAGSQDPAFDPGETVRAARAGDREAFNDLVRRFQRRVYGLTLMMTRNPQGAEEITQDTFIRAFTHFDRYDVRRPFYPWLATIAVRLTQNWQKRRALMEPREAHLEDHPTAAGEAPLYDLLEKERARVLWETVSSLPEGERTATLLFYRQNLKVAEVAQVLGVSGGTVKTLLFRARKRLRTQETIHSMGQARHKEKQP